MTNQRNNRTSSRKWYAMDLHLHTPASSDYQQPDTSYLDILKRAEARGLDMIAFADHNSVSGFRRMMEEVDQLELLLKLKRILPEEEDRLKEYKRLLGKIVVLPGFEFTATLGFHVLGIFPPDKPVREIEYLLLDLNVPADQLDEGSATIGAGADVLTAYRVISEAGGLAIAAHVNSSNGVAMRGLGIGGQTKIAYTQDSNLIALEVTDLEQRGRRTTASFFSGIKPEYPRKMHCIQGSDAHRLDTDTTRKKNLGVGDRVTEVLLPKLTFNDLKDLFLSNDFARTRPRRGHKDAPVFDFVRGARDEGSNIVQEFHEVMTVKGGHLNNVIADVCAFANTNGGTLYVGMNNDPKSKFEGVKNPSQAINQLEKEISSKISPELVCTVDDHKTDGKNIIRVLVPKGDESPYAVDDNKIYIREEAETSLAVRDEIVGLVMRGQNGKLADAVSLVQKAEPLTAPTPRPANKRPTRKKTPPKAKKPQLTAPKATQPQLTEPRTGVEIVSVVERNGTTYYSLRDLRNGSTVKNVTAQSARKLWHYAIRNHAKLPKDMKKDKDIKWDGDLGIIRSYKQGNRSSFDLAQVDGRKTRVYWGVTEDGVSGKWRKVLGLESD